MTLYTAPDVRFNLHECIDNRVGYLRFFSFTVVLCAIGCLLMCQKKKKGREQINERKNERNILNITLLLLINIYIYSICDYEEHTSLCDPFLFSLYAFSGLLLSIYRCCRLHRAVLERLEKKKKKKKKGKKKLRDALRCIYPIWREKREENEFFFLLVS